MAHFFEAYLPASWQVEAFSKYPPTKCRREKAEQWSRFWDEVHNEAHDDEAHDVEAHDREAHGRKLLPVKVRILPASAYWRMSRQPSPRDQPNSDGDVFVIRRIPRPKSASTHDYGGCRKDVRLVGEVCLPHFQWSPWDPNGEAFRGTTFAAWLSSMCLSSLCNMSLHGGIHVHRSLIIEHDEENSNKDWVCAGSRKAPALTGRCIRQRRRVSTELSSPQRLIPNYRSTISLFPLFSLQSVSLPFQRMLFLFAFRYAGNTRSFKPRRALNGGHAQKAL